MKRFAILSIVVVAVLLTACSLAADVTPPPGYRPPATPTLAVPVEKPNPARGAALYAEKCAPCHGVTGQGDGDLAAQLLDQGVEVPALGSLQVARQASPARWFGMVTVGNLDNFMPSFRSLSDQQRWDVVAYALTLSTPPEVVAAGQALFGLHCVECHDTSPDLARLSALSPAAMEKTILDGVDKMPAFTALSEDERWQLTAYMRSRMFSMDVVAAATVTPAEVTVTSEPTPTLEASSSLTATTALSGTVSGVVTHATGSALPAGLEVILYAIDNSADTPRIAYTLTTTTAEDGSFAFQNVALVQGQLFGAGLDYQGAMYGSRIETIETGTAGLELPIEVYDSTTDISGLVVERVHFIFTFDQADQVSVMEIYAIDNPTNRTVVASEKGGPVVMFPLPEAAENLTFQDGKLGQRYIPAPGGFADTEAVYPGTGAYQVAVGYMLPYHGSLDFSLPVVLNTAAVTVLVPEGGVSVQGLRDGGLFEGSNYHRYDADALPQGSELKFTLRGKPGQNANLLSGLAVDRRNLTAGLASLGLVLIALGVWLYQRSKKLTTPPAEQADASGEPSGDADTLMDAILALDDQFQAGQIPEEAYRARRAELKTQLRERLGAQGS